MTRPTDTQRTQAPSLRADQSGAIMVLGLFMAVVLVGFIYFVIGIGESIYYRERMQDGADAGAWASAVLHARGMNAIVLINMIMAAIAAVLIALKMVLFLVDIGIVVAGIACAIPYTAAVGCPAETALQELRPTVKSAHDAVESFANTALPLLNKAATALARAVPLLAEVKVVELSRSAYHPPADLGIFYSKTLTEGLPVEDDRCEVLEERAQGYIEDLVSTPFHGTGPLEWIFRRLTGFMGDAAQTFYGSVCGETSGGSREIDTSNALASDREEHGCGGENPPQDCNQESTSEPAQVTPERGFSGDSSTRAPKRVVEDVWLGQERFQVRSLFISNDGYSTMEDNTRRGVQMATWGRENSASHAYATLGQLARASFAQAEFYWESGDGSDAQGVREDWMWKMNWRARLRRFRMPSDASMSSACSGGGGGSVCNALGSGGDLLNAVIVH